MKTKFTDITLVTSFVWLRPCCGGRARQMQNYSIPQVSVFFFKLFLYNNIYPHILSCGQWLDSSKKNYTPWYLKMLHNYFLPVIKYLFPYETANFFLLYVGIWPAFRSVSTLCWFHLAIHFFMMNKVIKTLAKSWHVWA